MFQDITVENLLELHQKQEIVLIDVRSPQEFEDATIPGSHNIPLFDGAERSEIGTLYKQVSIQAAKERGLEIVSAKLPQFIKQFESFPGKKAVFCWRGGMRSKTAATLASLMGMKIYRLQGGIRAYRKWVVDTLSDFEWNPDSIVINGYTGTGKTRILQLLSEKGYPVIDLEHLAQHRGSVFGQIGLSPNNQKTFESLLLHELLRLKDEKFVVMEAESKRIGKVVLPDFLLDQKQRGLHIFIDLPIKSRVRHIMELYKPELHLEQCFAAFLKIKKHIHTPAAAEIEHHLTNGQFEEAIALLLTYYYDPRYVHAFNQYGSKPIICKAGSIEEAAEKVMDLIQSHYRTSIQTR